MKTIPLAQGKIALVDDADYYRLSQWKWTAEQSSGVWYAYRKVKSRTVRMHCEILKTTGQVDHADHNGLNNQRYNLRATTNQQNQANSRKWSRPCSSLYKGVCWDGARSKWLARIKKDDRRFHLGLFVNELDAAMAYDKAACDLFGSHAGLNLGAPV